MWVLSKKARTTFIILAVSAYANAASAGDGLYASVGLGTGSFTGSNLITKDPNGSNVPAPCATCGPDLGFTFDVRAGFSFLATIAPEVVFVGNTEKFHDGAGFIGGGLRFYPLGLAQRVMTRSEPLIPFEASIGGSFGYTMLGDGDGFAYTGMFVGVDGTFAYILADFVTLGLRFLFIKPMLDDFIFEDFGGDQGFCLDGSGLPVGTDAPPRNKSQAGCSGSGPDTAFLSPQVLVNFHFDVF